MTHGWPKVYQDIDMTLRPLQLSPALYNWDHNSADAHVSIDPLHQCIISIQSGGFHIFDISSDVAAPAVFNPFDLEGLGLIRLSPANTHFAFLCDRKRIGCVGRFRPATEHIPITTRWNRGDTEVLDFFWLRPPAPQTQHADLVVMTVQGIEIFRFMPEQLVVKSVKAFPVVVRLCWIDPRYGIALVCRGPQTLQNFDFRTKVPQKMPKFDLVLERDKVIEAHDVCVMTIYDTTFCIHADGGRGRVSLRNISSPSQGSPEHDIIIDTVGCEHPCNLRLSQVDNLLIVHSAASGVSHIFDIRHRVGNAVLNLCCAQPVSDGDRPVQQNSMEGWVCAGGPVIVDMSSGVVNRLKVDVTFIMKELNSLDLATATRFLLRRSNCRSHVINKLKEALVLQIGLGEIAHVFGLLNHAYRRTIQSELAKSPTGTDRSSEDFLNKFESPTSHWSFVSEKQMILHVFYTYFLETEGLKNGHTCESSESLAKVDDVSIINLPKPNTEDSGVHKSWPSRSPYIVSVLVAYLRSLSRTQIDPHKTLQCFVFDICMYYHQEHTLQQLLHYHVLLDSPELVCRLKEVSVKGRRWAIQACLDMAVRCEEHVVMAEVLLHTRQYLDVACFVRQKQVSEFKVKWVLEQIDADAEAQAKDPYLMEHVLSEIRNWQYATANINSTRASPPDLKDCERWLPDLF